MKMLLKTVVALALSLTSPALYGQGKAQVNLDCTCDDPVGAEVAMKLRDAIAASPRYGLTSVKEYKNQQGHETYNWVISIVSMDPTKSTGAQASATVMSIVINLGKDIYYSQSVRYCGSDIVASCADRILANFDRDITTP